MFNNLRILKNFNVMFVDDDEHILEEIEYILGFFFKNVFIYNSPQKALDDFFSNAEKVDVIITDLRMPLFDGIYLCKKIREVNKNIPIFICSSHTDLDDILKLIKFNLVDYLVKPLSLNKLEEAFFLLLEKLEIKNQFYIKDNLIYDFDSKVIIFNGIENKLTKNEIKLIEFLIRNHSNFVTREQLEIEIFEYDKDSDNALRNLIWRLRKKIGEDSIETLKNVGFKLNMKS